MKKFESHQEDAIAAKLFNPSLTVFESLDNGEAWRIRPDDAPFSFNQDVLYLTCLECHKKAAEACLLDGKTVEATYFGETLEISKGNIFNNFANWIVFHKNPPSTIKIL